MGRVVLVTGVSRDLGRRFARTVANDPAVDRVIGVDVVPPRGDVGHVSFVRADIRNPVIAKVIVKEDVDTLVHMSVIATPGSTGGRVPMKELNVIGTMQLLAACQKAPAAAARRRQVLDHDVRRQQPGPRHVHRGHGRQAAADVRLRQGRPRDRGLRARVRPSPARRPTDHAPRRQRARPPRDQPDGRLLPAPGHPHRSRFRPAPSVPAREGPARRAAPCGPPPTSRAPSTWPGTAS